MSFPEMSALVSDGRLPSSLPTLTTEQMRQKLAGLLDLSASRPPEFREACRSLAIQFCAALPRIFGESLDRLTLWDRIASAIQTAHAKTTGGDIDAFVQHVCEHIKADPSRAVADDEFGEVSDRLFSATDQERREWMTYVATHLIPVLTQARRRWELAKQQAKAAQEVPA